MATVDAMFHASVPITQVLPRLFLGSVHALDDGCAVPRMLGVTCVVSLAPRLSDANKAVVMAAGFKHVHFVEVSHDGFEDVAEQLLRLLANLVDDPDNSTLVHCRSGMHRSVALVTGYLMLSHRSGWRQSFGFVKRLRPCADPTYRKAIKAAVSSIATSRMSLLLDVSD